MFTFGTTKIVRADPLFAVPNANEGSVVTGQCAS